MPLPELTHLQFFVLDLIKSDPHSGRFIRERLAEEGEKKVGPAFYQLMSRLEENGLVSGWYESFVLDGQTIKERRYEITPHGKRSLKKLQEFYIAKCCNGLGQDETQSGSTRTVN